MKKNIFRVVSLLLVMVLSMTLLAGCGQKPSGKYTYELLGQEMSYTFSGSDVTFSVTILGTVKSVDGTYSINDAGDEITLTFDNDDVEGASSGTFAYSLSEDKSTVKIGAVTYKKAE